MRYLKKQSISRNALVDSRVSVDIYNGVVMNTTNSLLMPSGADLNRPLTPVNGMIRYNTDSGEVEVYQDNTWRALRYKESVGIIQQQVGIGNDIETLFGPLNPPPPTIVESNSVWSGANLIVLVENVIQIFQTNFIVTELVDNDPIGNPLEKTAGWYITFDNPVPLGKPVTVLHGFDR